MNDPNAPLLHLLPMAGSRSTKKRHERPPGSMNWNKGYKCIRRETAGVNFAFETAFRHIPITETPEVPNEADMVRNQSKMKMMLALQYVW